MKQHVLVLLLLGAVTLTLAGSIAEWKQRTIYQVLTDRFARSDGQSPSCNINDYCGGNFQGIIDKLDYIAGMGFDAIWISPIVLNTAKGYHGYWAQDLTKVNPHFGDESSLKALVSACHSRGIWVMLDVVGNHVGPVGYDYSNIVPFNQASHYHDCNNCPIFCSINDFNNQNQVQLCRLDGLPVLNQTNPYVGNYLTTWISNIISTYGFDGLRIDTTPEVEKSFWSKFTQAAGVYTVGEVDNGVVSYVAGYQGYVDATLSYPMFYTLRNVFAQQQSMTQIHTRLQSYAALFKDPTILGTFSDNHDNPRFLSEQKDYELYKNALAYVIMGEGIPIIYYGSEQGYSGGASPASREALWPNYSTSSDLYKYIQTVVKTRKSQNIFNQPHIQRYVDDHFYAFTRGQTFVALTNGVSNQGQIVRTITYHPYSNGDTLCNVFYTNDCVQVQNGSFKVYLDHGESKIFVLK